MYMVTSRVQNARQSHNVKFDNSSFQRAEQLKNVGITRTNQNSVQEEIKS
jgi:post-segregation antitoxin (ccd killing protein)